MLLFAVDLKLFPDLDGIVHGDHAVGVGHHGLVLVMIILEVFLRTDIARLVRLLGICADGADIDMVLFLDIGLGVPDVPDVDDLVRLDLARMQGCGSLRQRLIGAGDRLRTIRLVFQQRAAGAQIILIIL